MALGVEIIPLRGARYPEFLAVIVYILMLYFLWPLLWDYPLCVSFGLGVSKVIPHKDEWIAAKDLDREV